MDSVGGIVPALENGGASFGHRGEIGFIQGRQPAPLLGRHRGGRRRLPTCRYHVIHLPYIKFPHQSCQTSRPSNVPLEMKRTDVAAEFARVQLESQGAVEILGKLIAELGSKRVDQRRRRRPRIRMVQRPTP